MLWLPSLASLSVSAFLTLVATPAFADDPTPSDVAPAEPPLDEEAVRKAAREDTRAYAGKEWAAWRKADTEYRAARPYRAAGVLLTVLGGIGALNGAFFMAASREGESGGVAGAGAFGVGGLAVGGLFLMFGIPMLVNAYSGHPGPQPRLVAVSVDARHASLAWSF